MKKIKLIAAGLLCLAVLSSCAGKPQIGSGQKQDPPADDFVPSTLAAAEESLAEYEEYKKKAEGAFADMAETEAEAFKYSVSESGVTVEGYIGQSRFVRIPEKIENTAVTKIAEGAFKDTDIRSLYIPDSVKTVEKSALEGANSLQLIRIPFVGDGKDNGHIGYIFGADAFDTNALKIPASLETVIVGKGETVIGERAFYGAKNIDAVVLEGAESIEKFAFYGCESLVYAGLGEKLESIGGYAFGLCTSLVSISLPASTQSTGLGVFYLCTSMARLNTHIIGNGENPYIGYMFGAESKDWNEDFVPASLAVVKLGEGIKKIENGAFEECRGIVSVSLPESLESIGVRAFAGCRSLVGISTGKDLCTIYGDAFFGCDSLTSLAVNGKTNIMPQAFYGCDKLTEENKYISPDATVAEGAFEK